MNPGNPASGRRRRGRGGVVDDGADPQDRGHGDPHRARPAGRVRGLLERWLITLNGTPTDPNADAYFLWAETETADDDNGWADTDGDPEGGYWG